MIAPLRYIKSQLNQGYRSKGFVLTLDAYKFYIRFSKLTRDIEPIDMEIQIGDMSCMGYVFLKGNIHVTCNDVWGHFSGVLGNGSFRDWSFLKFNIWDMGNPPSRAPSIGLFWLSALTCWWRPLR